MKTLFFFYKVSLKGAVTFTSLSEISQAKENGTSLLVEFKVTRSSSGLIPHHTDFH